MNKSIIIVFFAVFVFGCAGSPVRISMMSAEELSEQHTLDLCNTYHMYHSKNVKKELIERNVITDREWELIESNKIKIGMSEAGLVCSWGYPGLWGNTNEMVMAGDTHRQWIYRGCDLCKPSYVYTTGGKVTSWIK